MKPLSALLLPPPELSSCIFAAIFRDTRGAALSDSDRFNHFPASPLVSVTFVIEGELRLLEKGEGLSEAQKTLPIVAHHMAPPQDKPVTSWSPGPVAVVTVGFYPDAWMKLEQSGAASTLPEALETAFATLIADDDITTGWGRFCTEITASWLSARSSRGLADWSGSQRMADWSRSMLARAALAGPGRSVRALERRVRRWSHQSQRSLKFFSDIDNLHELATDKAQTSLASIASDAGYADQSHMGRAVRRATGFSPAVLNRYIETKEAFWCYRLLGKRF